MNLREKQMLLVLDNVEHLLKGVGLFVEILQHAPGVKLLVTSHESLDLQGEWVFEVTGLNVPENELADGFEDYSAVALFLQRARRARGGFALDARERAAVARICRQVEGMPLAIELAATWVRTLSLPEIAAEIERNLDFLSTSVRDLPERHRSMRAVFDYSWQMLSAEESVLCRLSVFRGGFRREAAEQVAGASLSSLSALVTRSLVRRTFAGRYDLHELVRQYAVERLHENVEAELAARNRHSHYYLTLLQERETALCSSRQKDAVSGRRSVLARRFCRSPRLKPPLGNHYQQPAQQCFVEALQVAFKAHSYANALDALVEIAAVLAHSGKHVLALELALCILQHPSAAHQAQTRAEQLGAELEARLTPQQIEAARASVQAQPFEAIVQIALGCEIA